MPIIFAYYFPIIFTTLSLWLQILTPPAPSPLDSPLREFQGVQSKPAFAAVQLQAVYTV
jgi:hypothetical protein